MDWLLMAIAVLAATFMVVVDRARFGTYYTPAAILGVPYVTIALIAFVVGPLQGYVALYTPSVVVWIAYLFIFWVSGHMATAFFPDSATFSSRSLDEDSARPTAAAIAWLVIPVLAYGTWSASTSVGFVAFHRPEYREMVTSGIAGHALMLGIPPFICLSGVMHRKNLMICGGAVALLLILMALRPTKSWVLLPLAAGLLCRIRTGRLRLSLKGVALTVLAMYGLFNLSYLIAFGASNSTVFTDPQVYAELSTHAQDYLFAGVLGFSSEMEAGHAYPPDREAVYANLMNLKSLALGENLVPGIETNFSEIRPGADGFAGNVHTLFGMLIMSLGYWEAALYSAVLGLVAYSVFLASWRSPDLWLSTMWCFVAACLAFGWFGTYFSQLPVLEISGYCLLLFVAGQIFRKDRRPSLDVNETTTRV